MGIWEENNLAALDYEDETTREVFRGEKRLVTLKTISYTGWKLVGVIPYSTFTHGIINIRYFIVMFWRNKKEDRIR